jgi:multiple antibiotic resistance protein
MILLTTAGRLRALPFYHSATAAADVGMRHRIALRAALTSAVALLAFLFVGESVLKGLHVRLPAPEIAAGIILLTVALALVRNDGTAAATYDAAPTRAPGIGFAHFPLALPLMASPRGLIAIVSLADGGDRV